MCISRGVASAAGQQHPAKLYHHLSLTAQASTHTDWAWALAGPAWLHYWYKVG